MSRPVRHLLVVAALLVVAGSTTATRPVSAEAATQFGLSDQQPVTWADPRVRALGLQHARLIISWDSAISEPGYVQAWLDAVAAAGLQPHIVFGRLRSDNCPGAPCVLPTRAQYRAGVDAFRARWPQVTTFTTWNEANHFTQPVARNPEAVAGFWSELTAACASCTIVAGDVLDSGPYVQWLERFKRAAAPAVPRRWGLHNYADASYGTTDHTDTVLATVPGELWIEETGGIVTLRDEAGRVTFSTSESRAAAGIDGAFAIARARPRITRMYVYHWKAHTLRDTFDAGLVRPDGTARESLRRMAANVAGFNSTGALRPARADPQVELRARWSRRMPRQLLLTVRCVASGGVCRGRVRVATETKRSTGAAMRTTRLAQRRAYTTTRSRRTATVRITVTRSVAAMLRSAKTRRLAIALTATRPVAARANRALRLGAPPRR